jgi:pyruvate/2-oxoglutarate dehydrogenase complex dihydrolipoamide acyltransferase (E2) component
MIPQAGVAMTEGTIVAWLVSDGDRVTAGQPLYTLETEKVEMDVECPDSGVVRITGSVGTTYAVGDVVGRVETT